MFSKISSFTVLIKTMCIMSQQLKYKYKHLQVSIISFVKILFIYTIHICKLIILEQIKATGHHSYSYSKCLYHSLATFFYEQFKIPLWRIPQTEAWGFIFLIASSDPGYICGRFLNDVMKKKGFTSMIPLLTRVVFWEIQ